MLGAGGPPFYLLLQLASLDSNSAAVEQQLLGLDIMEHNSSATSPDRCTLRWAPQAVKRELLEALTMTAERAGYNKSVLVVGARGSGKTLVCSRAQLTVFIIGPVIS